MKGGKREGAGRPVTLNPASVKVQVWMTEEQRFRFMRIGGSRWLKRTLDELPQPRAEGAGAQVRVALEHPDAGVAGDEHDLRVAELGPLK